MWTFCSPCHCMLQTSENQPPRGHITAATKAPRHVFSKEKKKIPNMCSTSLSKKKPNFPGMHPALPPPTPSLLCTPPPSFSTSSSSSSSTHNRRPALAFPMCLRACIEGDGRLGGFGLFLNLQGPRLLAGTPSLFRIVASVLRSDLESVLTGNQQFLR